MTALVERLAENKYCTSTVPPVAMDSEGSSLNDAVEWLSERAVQRLKASEFTQVSIPGVSNANQWFKFSGIWKDHPDVDRFLDNIDEYRRTIDSNVDSNSRRTS